MNIKNRFTLSEENKFFLTLFKSYKLDSFLFVSGSFLTSILDGISIGMLIPLLNQLQNGQLNESLPNILGWLTEFLVDYSIAQQFMISLGFVVVLVIVKNILLGFVFQKGVQLSNHIAIDARVRVSSMLMNVGLDFHHKSKAGELVDKTINYTSKLKELILALAQFIVFALMFAILFLLMIILSWKMSIIVVVLGSIVMAIISIYLNKIRSLGYKQASASMELTNAVQENLNAIQLVKSYNKETKQLNILKTKIEAFAAADNKVGARRYWVQPITEGLGVIIIGIIIMFGYIILPVNEIMPLTLLLPILYILLRLTTTLTYMNNSKAHTKSLWPYLKLVFDLVREDDKPFIPNGTKLFTGLDNGFSFNEVSFSYDQEKLVLDDISFSIPRGKTTAIVGKSGAGKSTIVNLLLRFYDPKKGHVFADGEPLTSFMISSYRSKISYVSQELFIFHDSVKFNIAFGVDENVTEEQIIEAAKKAGAHQFIMELPNGYDTILGDRGITLSGGQRQRISIARALLRNSEILILDEATSSLDAITEKGIHDTILDLKQGRTVVIIAHRFSTIKIADKIIVIKDGKIVEQGSPEALLELKNEYYDLVQAQ